MKRTVVPLILSLFIAGAAYAQGAATAPASPPAPSPAAPAAGAGSAAPPGGSASPNSDQGSAAAAGSGSAAGSAAGVAAPAAAGSGAGSAAAVAKPPIVVPCPAQPKYRISRVADIEVPTEVPIELDLGGGDVIPDKPADTALAATPHQVKCVTFQEDGAYGIHTSSSMHATVTVKAWYDVEADQHIQEQGTFWLPKAVNAAANGTDFMFYSVLGLSLFFFVAIAGLVVYFTWKYRHRPGHKSEPSPAHNDALEITWTVIPTIIVVFLFWYGWKGYVNEVTPPEKAVEIQVLAWQWNWQFTHENGVTDSDLHVPVNTPVRLVMTSKDVIHSFYVPVMRIKQDIVPRRYTYAWFEATKPGTYRLTCAEYCGTNHAQMGCLKIDPETGACMRRAVVVVHAPGDYERYLADKEAEQNNLPPVELGKRLYEKKGCISCHTVDGSARVGPSWKQPDWGKMIPMADGSQVKMDESYVKESILVPSAKARPGFPVGQMPSFEGQLKPKELAGLIAYIKSLKQ